MESWPEPESPGGGGGGRVGPSRRVPRWRWELARAGESRGGALESARAGESRASAGGGESARAGESRASAGGGESARGAAPRSSQKKNYTKYVTFIVTSQWGVVVHAIKYAENYEQKILIFIYVTRLRGSSQEQPKKENYIIKNFTSIVLIFIIICHM